MERDGFRVQPKGQGDDGELDSSTETFRAGGLGVGGILGSLYVCMYGVGLRYGSVGALIV